MSADDMEEYLRQMGEIPVLPNKEQEGDTMHQEVVESTYQLMIADQTFKERLIKTKSKAIMWNQILLFTLAASLAVVLVSLGVL